MLAFEAYHMRLFLKLSRRGLKEYNRLKGSDTCYPRSLYDSAFEVSFYVHLRVLVSFFYLNPKKDDDVCYFHFPMEHGRLFAPRPAPDADGLLTNLHKRVAHLTATRFLDPQPDLKYYLDKGDEISEVLTAFIESLSPDLQAAFNGRSQEFETRDSAFLQSGLVPKHFLI